MTIGKARRTGVRASPILSLLLCCANTSGAAICGEPDSYAANRRSAANIKNPRNFLIGAAKAPRFAQRRSECAPLHL
jgi:hypothetical protein